MQIIISVWGFPVLTVLVHSLKATMYHVQIAIQISGVIDNLKRTWRETQTRSAEKDVNTLISNYNQACPGTAVDSCMILP